MDTLEQETYQQTPKAGRFGDRRLGPAIAVATVLAVFAIGIAVVAALQSQPDVADTPAPPFDTPQQAAEAYLTSLVVGDYDAYQTLLTPDAWDRLLGNVTVVPAEKIEARFHWWSAYTGSFGDLQCTPESATSATCTYSVDDPGLATYTDGTVTVTRTFTIDNGLLVAISREEIAFTDTQAAASAAQNEWYQAAHPELANEIRRGLLDENDLSRSVGDIIADNNAALEQYAATLEN